MSEENKNIKAESPYEEESRLRRKRQRRKTTIGYVISSLGVFVGLFVVMILAIAAYSWVDSRTEEADSLLLQAMGEAQTTQEVTYTQAQLDQMIAEAVAQAQAQDARALEDALNQQQEEILGGIRGQLTQGETVVETLRPLYPDDIVLVSGGKYHFLPIRNDLKQHDYVQENLQILENGRYEYVEDGQVVSHMGIDVSKYQGDIDWEKVAAEGVEFAFLRVGLRGYGSGKIVEDDSFETNIQGALRNGIKVGVYFFSQATTEEEAIEEANFVLDKIAPYQVECPVVFDVEKVSDSTARMNQLTPQERTNVTIAFLDTIEAAGYRSMFYHNMETALLLLELDRLEDYDRWFAYYGEELYYPYQYSVWQYTDQGRIDGIDADVDLNIAFGMWQ